MSDIRQMANHFEAVQIAMSKSKDGHILKLAIHPNDIPEAVLRDPVGTRYQVALVRTGEDSAPIPSPVDEAHAKLVAAAGAMCHDVRFQQWMVMRQLAELGTETSVSQGLREYLGIKSRTELKTNPEARQRFVALREEFVYDLRSGKVIGG